MFDGKQKLLDHLSERRYVFHITTTSRYAAILSSRKILPRNLIGDRNKIDYSNKELVNLRGNFSLPSGKTVNDAVPFYLSPRQPMFHRLVRLEELKSNNLVAIGINFNSYCHELNHCLFNTNPIYPNSINLGGWENRHALPWDTLTSWDWQNLLDQKEDIPNLPPTWKRQAELLVESSVDINCISFVYIGGSMTRYLLCSKNTFPIYIAEGLFDAS